MQVTNSILMIRPFKFRMNEQTAVNNYYQKVIEDSDVAADKFVLGKLNETLNELAQKEFDAFVNVLKNVGINVFTVKDNSESDTPDSIFPNNWVSFHEDGRVGLYPMFAKNRRKERRPEILELLKKVKFEIKEIVDFTISENEGRFLEGTGSLVLDRVNRKAYCALSPRADEGLLLEFCKRFNYTAVQFTAYQTVATKRLPIYHTNVMMSVGETFAVVCLECIDDKKEQDNLKDVLRADGKEIIEITEKQVSSFAGNMLQVVGANEKRYLVMSSSAYQSLTSDQISRIDEHCLILHSDLNVIETLGGGSARCMMAEVFLPWKAEVYESFNNDML